MLLAFGQFLAILGDTNTGEIMQRILALVSAGLLASFLIGCSSMDPFSDEPAPQAAQSSDISEVRGEGFDVDKEVAINKTRTQIITEDEIDQQVDAEGYPNLAKLPEKGDPVNNDIDRAIALRDLKQQNQKSGMASARLDQQVENKLAAINQEKLPAESMAPKSENSSFDSAAASKISSTMPNMNAKIDAEMGNMPKDEFATAAGSVSAPKSALMTQPARTQSSATSSYPSAIDEVGDLHPNADKYAQAPPVTDVYGQMLSESFSNVVTRPVGLGVLDWQRNNQPMPPSADMASKQFQGGDIYTGQSNFSSTKKVTIEKPVLGHVASLYFMRGSATLSPQDMKVLKEVADLYAQEQNGSIKIIGYAPSAAKKGDKDYGIALQRGNSIRKALQAYGITDKMMSVSTLSDASASEAEEQRAEVFFTTAK